MVRHERWLEFALKLQWRKSEFHVLFFLLYDPDPAISTATTSHSTASILDLLLSYLPFSQTSRPC